MQNLNLDSWLASFLEEERTPATRGVLAVLAQQPEFASHASAAEIAREVGVTIGSVTRAAQSLGFTGWPALREELRARFLSSLSMTEIATNQVGLELSGALKHSFDSDLRAISRTASRVDPAVMGPAVAAFAAADTRLAIGGGTYGGVAQIFSLVASLCGYVTYAPGEGGPLVNAISRLGPGDFLLAVSVWRAYEGTVNAVTAARERGATVCVITDHQKSPLTEVAHFTLPSSAEGGSFFPSMAASVAVANAFCAELAQVDPERTRGSVREAEAEWTRQHLLRRP